MKSVLLVIIAIVSLGLNSCKDQIERDDLLIEEYLEDNNLTAEITPEGVYYIIEKEGTGNSPDINSTVTVHYRGYTLDGYSFDSSYDRGEKSTFPLVNVIQGWQIGIPLFKEGGSGKLFIPSHLAYGENPPPGPIGKNEVLAFDIELFEVE
jgi:FKBP-type peptidyl-prolyl cis-trans isomerase FkpA